MPIYVNTKIPLKGYNVCVLRGMELAYITNIDDGRCQFYTPEDMLDKGYQPKSLDLNRAKHIVIQLAEKDYEAFICPAKTYCYEEEKADNMDEFDKDEEYL